MSPQAQQASSIQHHALQSDQLSQLDGHSTRITDWSNKGKASSQTHLAAICQSSIHHDYLDVYSPPVVSDYRSCFRYTMPDFTACSPSLDDIDPTTTVPVPVQDLHDTNEMQVSISSVSSKGKQKIISSNLPPLSVSDMDCEQTPWSSFGSVSSPAQSPHASFSIPARDADSAAGEDIMVSDLTGAVSGDSVFSSSLTRCMPSQCSSFSTVSLHHTPSHASLNMSKINVRLTPTTQGNLVRKLSDGKQEDPNSSVSSQIASFTPNTTPNLDSTIIPCCAAPLQHRHTSLLLSFPRPRVGTESRIRSRPSLLRFGTKNCPRSSPISFSALDLIPASGPDIFKPLPLLHQRYFDRILPKELQLYILKCFAHSIEDDHIRSIAEEQWTITRAISSRNQFVGRDRGIRELLKLARVSRSFKSLVYDGQLWADLDLHSFPEIPEPILLRLMSLGGAFIRKINLAGHRCLQPSLLTALTDHLRAPLSYTNLTSINLQGCSALTTCSLHHLLVRCKSLQRLCLKGLTAVTNTTCELLATFCTRLEHLNLNRCPNMNAEGIRYLARTTLAQGEYLRLKELKISGLVHMDDATMRVLGKAAPHLEVLDLSYIRQLHNSALESFVATTDAFDDNQSGVEFVRLHAHQIGRNSSGDYPQSYCRRITKLRHLSLSFCVLLTDMACSNLAYAVPHLEFFEMAGIGEDLKGDGLVQLLETTPKIRRLDLEDASDITDSVLSAITPIDEHTSLSHRQDDTSRPGHALEWLCVSHAGNISDGTFLALIHACSKLRVLEADNTKLSGNTLREFVHLKRQHNTFNAKIVALDCRNIVESDVKELGSRGETRPRVGIRMFWARRLGYVDGKDEMCEEDLKVGLDECDSAKVVVKSFYSWQTVDAVNSVREKRRKAGSRRTFGPSPDYLTDVFDDDIGGGEGTGFPRWFSSGRPGNGGNTSLIHITHDGCIIM